MASTHIEKAPRPAPQTGRVNQRVRTRHAIVVAGRGLLEDGHTPTVADAADAALVSRATAYRYFGSQEELLLACVIATGWQPNEELFARPDAPSDPEDRVAFVHDYFYDFIREREEVFRHFLRHQLLIGLQGGTPERTQRPGFRVGMLATALEPIAEELGPERLTRLQHALGVLIGTEAVIASRDSLHIDHDTARVDNQWACRLLVRAARAEAATESSTETSAPRTTRSRAKRTAPRR